MNDDEARLVIQRMKSGGGWSRDSYASYSQTRYSYDADRGFVEWEQHGHTGEMTEVIRSEEQFLECLCRYFTFEDLTSRMGGLKRPP